MKKQEYLKLAAKANKFHEKSWLVSVLTITRPKDKDKYEHLELIPESWGYSVWMEDGVQGEGDVYEKPNGEKEFLTPVGAGKVKIEDASPDTPLFSVKDRIQLDPTWFPNVFEPIDTPFGNVLFNAICVVPCFADRLPFIKGKFSFGDIESRIAPILQDTPAEGKPRSPGAVYCDELVKFQSSREHIKSIAHLLNQSASIKTISKSPELEKYKAKLALEYGDSLKDPVKLVEFENKLKAFDDEWLKGDPADGTFLTGKVRNVARKKMHLAIGSEPGFEQKSTVIPVTKSLDQGWPTDPTEHVSMINGIRHASLSRGKETIKGGVFAKHLLRAGNNFSIQDTDCGSKNGLLLKVTGPMVKRLVGRSIIMDAAGTVEKVDSKEKAASHEGKYVRMRSPVYCRIAGDSLCKVCASDALFLNPNGISIALTEMSSLVMTDFMKAMHDTTIKTTELDLDEIFS